MISKHYLSLAVVCVLTAAVGFSAGGCPENGNNGGDPKPDNSDAVPDDDSTRVQPDDEGNQGPRNPPAPPAARDEAPTIRACPDNRTVSASANCDAALPDLTGEVRADDDNDSSLTVTQDPVPGTRVGLGATQVTLKVADSAGNETACTTTVTVADDTPPTLSGLGGVWGVSANQNGLGELLDFSRVVLNDATDACDEDLQFSQNPAAGTLLEVGEHDIEVRVTDSSGNTARGMIRFAVSAIPGGSGFTSVTILHRGAEQIIAGPNVDPSAGTVTPPGYRVGGFKQFALSGDNSRIWYALFDEFPNIKGDPQTQLWSVNLDGSNAQRSILPNDVLRSSVLVETNWDGSVCYADNSNTQALRIYRATPGQPATTAFAYWTQAGGFIYGDIRGEFKISDDATRMVYRSFINDSIYGVNLTVVPNIPERIRDAVSLQHMGVNVNSMYTNIDLASDGSRWITGANYFNSSWTPTVRHVVWVGDGFGTGAIVAPLASPDPGVDRPSALQITDDGATFAYVVDPPALGDPSPIWIQQVTSTTRQEITDNRTALGGLVVSDDGSRLHTRTNRQFGPGSGSSFLEDVTTGRRLPAGTQFFSDAPGIDWGPVRLSDDGQIMVSSSTQGLYVLRDGVNGPAGFPTIDAISYKLETTGEDCKLTVRVKASSPRGVAAVFVNAYIEGLDPTEVVPNEENPFFRIRAGSRVDPVEGESGVWVIEIPLTNGEGECVENLLTGEYRLRITVRDVNDSMNVFQDFAPRE